MATKDKVVNEKFTSDDKQSFVPDPVTGNPHANRPADKTDAKETADPVPSPSKAKALSDAMSALAQFSHAEIADFTAGLGKEKNKRPLDSGFTKTLDGVVSPTTVKAITKEDLDDVFKDSELTEEQQDQVQTVFEAAVNAKCTSEVVRLEEEFETKLGDAIEEIRQELAEDADTYLSDVAETWLKENKAALESQHKVQLAETFMTALVGLLKEHNIVLPEQIDVVQDLTDKLEEANEKITSLLSKVKTLEEEVEGYQTEEAFTEMTEGLALTQVEKLRALAEGIEYSDLEDFVSKFKVIRDSLTESKSVTKTEKDAVLVEDKEIENADQPKSRTSAYAAHLSRSLKN